MIRNLARVKAPGLYWKKIKDRVLGRGYDLSLVFLSDKEMTRLNRKYRGKNGATNVLAFPLSRKAGEIFISLPFAIREARFLKKRPKEHILFLYIHSLLHLKGFSHNTPKKEKIMKKNEEKWLKILS